MYELDEQAVGILILIRIVVEYLVLYVTFSYLIIRFYLYT
jgi:hypothetical protein